MGTAPYNQRGKLVDFSTAGDFGGIGRQTGERERDLRFGNARSSVIHQSKAGRVALVTERLDAILDAAGVPKEIDYLSVDVEGSELEVLEAFPFDTHKARVITVEHNQDELRRTYIRDLLMTNTYVLLGQLKWDDVFVSELHIIGPYLGTRS